MLGSLPLFRDLVDAGLLVRPFPDSVATDLGYDLVTTQRASSRAEVAAFSDWITSVTRP